MEYGFVLAVVGVVTAMVIGVVVVIDRLLERHMKQRLEAFKKELERIVDDYSLPRKPE